MKKPFKIILLISIVLNIVFAGFQLTAYFQREKNTRENIARFNNDMKKYTEQRFVNLPLVKKNFFDTLYINYPDLINKKYLFINLWHTGDAWTDRTLPIYDTIIKPLRQDIGYLTITDEEEKYAKRVLKKDTSLIKNFSFIYSAEDFILAMNQELKIPFRKFYYPKCPMNLIFDTKNRNIVFYDTVGISGPRYPEDSLSDKEVIKSIKTALNELK